MSRVIIPARATRDSFLEAVYGAGLVASGPAMAAWTNKWFQHETLLKWNPRAAGCLPRTMRMRDWVPSPTTEALATMFPDGFVAKPAIGHSSEGRGFITDGAGLQAAWVELSLQDWLLQERVGAGFGPGAADEFRVHTFWHRVVAEATFSRWDVLWEDQLFLEIEAAVQAFLDMLPPALLRGHAWGLDVIRVGAGDIRIIDLNTNRGERRKWSGDLAVPDVLGAYVRHLERFHEVEFAGPEGARLRENQADPRKWIKKAGAESVRRHEELRRRSGRLRRYERGLTNDA
jgi:hypothetical protein